MFEYLWKKDEAVLQKLICERDWGASWENIQPKWKSMNSWSSNSNQRQENASAFLATIIYEGQEIELCNKAI